MKDMNIEILTDVSFDNGAIKFSKGDVINPRDVNGYTGSWCQPTDKEVTKVVKRSTVAEVVVADAEEKQGKKEEKASKKK